MDSSVEIGHQGSPGRATLEDVARIAGVSRATVSRVVTGSRPVKPDIREVVEAAIEQTGYIPNRAARALVTRRAGAVAILISSAGADDENQEIRQIFGDPFFGRIANAAAQALRTHDVHPLLMVADSQRARRQTLNFLVDGGVDGALLVTTHSDDPMATMIVDARVPVVNFALPAGNLQMSYVDVSGYDGGAIAADHLISKGRKRLAVIGASGDLAMPSINERVNGFLDRAAKAGITDIPVLHGDLLEHSGIDAAQELLEKYPDVDGLFAVNDYTAVNAMNVLQEHGKKIPEDIAVIGFDDSTIASQATPPLTTVSQPMEDVARAMTDQLMHILNEPGFEPQSIVLAPTLVERESA